MQIASRDYCRHFFGTIEKNISIRFTEKAMSAHTFLRAADHEVILLEQQYIFSCAFLPLQCQCTYRLRDNNIMEMRRIFEMLCTDPPTLRMQQQLQYMQLYLQKLDVLTLRSTISYCITFHCIWTC